MGSQIGSRCGSGRRPKGKGKPMPTPPKLQARGKSQHFGPQKVGTVANFPDLNQISCNLDPNKKPRKSGILQRRGPEPVVDESPKLQQAKSMINLNQLKQQKQGSGRIDISRRRLTLDKRQFIHEGRGKLQVMYDFLETIGIGAYGEVRKVRHRTSNQIRAMKTIATEDMGAGQIGQI